MQQVLGPPQGLPQLGLVQLEPPQLEPQQQGQGPQPLLGEALHLDQGVALGLAGSVGHLVVLGLAVQAGLQRPLGPVVVPVGLVVALLG